MPAARQRAQLSPRRRQNRRAPINARPFQTSFLSMPKAKRHAASTDALLSSRGTCPGTSSSAFGSGSKRFAGRFLNIKNNRTRIATIARKVTVLMLGDSHCRWMVNDLCSSHLCVSDDWGKGEFHYQQPCAICEAQHKANIRTRPTIAATTLCTTPPGDRLGLLMVYGLMSTVPCHGVHVTLPELLRRRCQHLVIPPRLLLVHFV